MLTYAGLGILIRLVVSNLFENTLENRVEITTPINSWKRAHEAVFLWDLGYDPYAGNIFHEFPLSLLIYKTIIKYFNVNLIFSILDTLVAVILYHCTRAHLSLNNLKTKAEAHRKADFVFKSYLFSPLAIISCSGHATSVLTNLIISTLCLTFTTRRSRTLTCFLCALLTCNNLHYATLTIPALLCSEYYWFEKEKNVDKQDISSTKKVLIYYEQPNFGTTIYSSVVSWLISLASLLLVAYLLMGGTLEFMISTFLFVLKVQDLTPNIGMFWYFFTEVFEHFASFFTWVVQINAFIHAIPLSVTLKDSPFFAFYATYLTSTIFQPYPSLTNMALLLSLTFQWSDLFQHMRRILIVCCACITCMSLWPVFWHLWIIMGTANANFYFGATLAFSTSLILFMIDILNAHSLVDAKLKFKENIHSESVIS